MKILALDLSLNHTGVCNPYGVSTLLEPPKGCVGIPRLAWYYGEAKFWLAATKPGLVVIEGYSYASKYGGEKLGEVGGVVRFACHQEDVPVAVFPPKIVKKYATGQGNAGKAEVLAAAVRRFPGWEGHNDNEADALWLWAAAMEKAGHPVVDMPKTHKAFLDHKDIEGWPATV